MQEVRDLTAVLGDSIAFVRKAHADARDTLATELVKARANVDKVNSMTRDFKQANMELEAFISGTGSNFPPAEHEDLVSEIKPQADINGVTLNAENKK